MEPDEISWVAPEYYHYPKTPRWFWISLIAAVTLVAVAAIQKNFLFAVFVVIAELLVVTWGRRIPSDLTFTISPEGVRLDKKGFYPYTNLLGFAFLKPEIDPEFDELVLHTKNTLSTFVKILIPKEERETIGEYLRQFVPEVEYEESLVEHLERIFNF